MKKKKKKKKEEEEEKKKKKDRRGEKGDHHRKAKPRVWKARKEMHSEEYGGKWGCPPRRNKSDVFYTDRICDWRFKWE